MAKAEQVPSNPKRQANIDTGKAAWYGYYAGFSSAFVKDVIGLFGVDRSATIIDPWNGAGTTTQVAHDLGYSAFGYDLNPAMVLVAKARLLGAGTEPSHLALCSNILRKATDYCAPVLKPDPLGDWFAPGSAMTIRSIERALQSLLINDGKYRCLAAHADYGGVSSLAAFFYVALFRAVRQLLNTFQASNPTWLKLPSRRAARLRPSAALIRGLFRQQVAAMAATLPESAESAQGLALDRGSVQVTVADSRSLPLAANSVDAIVASPPYCTRLDYTVATRPELAVLGYTGNALRTMRTQMIGTATIGDTPAMAKSAWGPACNLFLESIRTHKSRASESYYWKNHLQYFEGLCSSLNEIHRILRPATPCVLVVQDSFYKEIRNDLATYVTEMAGLLGFTLKRRYDYGVDHTFAGLHAHRKTYRSHATAIESVLWFVRQ